jgi:hypothetical protein
MNKPSFKNIKERITKRNLKKLGLFLLATSAITDGGLLYNYAPANKFTLGSTFGKVADETTPSGLNFHFAPVYYVHDYRKEVQTIDFCVGGIRFMPFGKSTADQNHLNADVKLNYRVTEDEEKLGYHAWEMDGYLLPDGYWLLTDMMNQSANAIMGQRQLAETTSDPERFTEEFYEDLAFRLEQNNVPVDLESIEFEGFGTNFPTRSVSYQKVVNSKTVQAPL